MSLQDELREKYQIDILADEAGGYVSPPSEEGLAYTDLFFSVCKQFGMSCGKPGKLRNDLSWIQTLCDDCYKKQ